MAEDITIKDSGPRRHAILVAPRNATQPAPLVILLHGKGGTAQWAMEETRFDELARREGFLLLAPDSGRLRDS